MNEKNRKKNDRCEIQGNVNERKTKTTTASNERKDEVHT